MKVIIDQMDGKLLEKIRPLILNASPGRVISKYKQVINIEFSSPHCLIAIAVKSVISSPNMMKTKNSFSFIQLREATQIGESVYITEEEIVIGNYRLNFAGAEPWLYLLSPICLRQNEIRERYTSLVQFIERHGKTGGIRNAFLFHNGLWVNSSYQQTVYDKYFDKLLHQLDQELTIENLNQFIGLGVGLTPSGDDFITGLLSVFYCYGLKSSSIKKMFAQFKTSNLEKKTTIVSYFMLKNTLESNVNEALYNYLTNGSSLEEIVKIGSTSGTDMLVGICVGLGYLLNRNGETELEMKVIIEKNAYHDSVTLMSLSGKVLQQEGVVDAVVSMATEMNKNLLENIGMMTAEVQSATENDLMIAVKTKSGERLEEIIGFIDEQLNTKKSSKNKQGNESMTSFRASLDALPDANIAVISVPGEYAAREARQALNNGLNVMIFSDNVTIEEERDLKRLGAEKNLLVMGPDCGTAMISGTGLCFANNVRQGGIGLVAASGTGLQEVAVQIDRMGYGITHAIGTGGRDLHEKVGGIMMLEGLNLLNEDEDTKVITLISKPPSKSVQDKILDRVKEISKPVVVCFLDGDKEAVEQSGASFAATLLEGARQSILALDETATFETGLTEEEQVWIRHEVEKLDDSQKYVKGLFCGGTLTAEALSLLRDEVEGIKSNVAKRESEKITDTSLMEGHLLLDMGDDEFTKGKPHPMIEPNLRNERILKEAMDETTAVLLLDFEIGYGSHEDPVGESLETLLKAKKIAEENNRHLSIVAYICGTPTDKQGLKTQEDKLLELGAFIADSNEKASKVAGKIANKEVK